MAAYRNLGRALAHQERPADAEAAYRRGIDLNPDDAGLHYNRGLVLTDLGRLAEAEASYRRAIALLPDHPDPHCNLGQLLGQQGRFSEAVVELRIGHELGSKKKNWRYPSAQWLRNAEQHAKLDAKLPDFLSGAAEPADADEQIALAQICLIHKKLYTAAVQFYAGAFAAEPRLAVQLNAHRFNAACAGAMAGCGQGEDGAKTNDAERERFRKQALEWLTADLTAWTNLVDNAADRLRVRKEMQRWQSHPAFTGVRDAAALARLPDAERAEWQKLWTSVAELLKRTDEPKPAEKPEKKH